VVTTKCGKDYGMFYKCYDTILQGLFDKLSSMRATCQNLPESNPVAYVQKSPTKTDAPKIGKKSAQVKPKAEKPESDSVAKKLKTPVNKVEKVAVKTGKKSKRN